ncbi:XRE family transcriptional regulator [Pseudomonas leptonychotis]|uniref:XRE family transcriptional regulator n=1 Tax=Pseudomonas leptonychotis TaxID=2448482 RepID=UPI0038669C30
MHTTIDKVLARLMSVRGVSQTELSKATGVNQSTISRILNPSAPKGIKSPKDEQVRPLADYFGVTGDQMRGYEPLPEKIEAPILDSSKFTVDAFDFFMMGSQTPPKIEPVSKKYIKRQEATKPEVIQNVQETNQPYKADKEYPLISWVAAGSWQESCDNFHPGDAETWIKSDAQAGSSGYWLEVKGPSMLPTFTPGMRILVRPEGFDLISGKLYIAKLIDTGETTFKQYLRDGGQGYLHPLNPAFPVIRVSEDVALIGQVIDARLSSSLF